MQHRPGSISGSAGIIMMADPNSAHAAYGESFLLVKVHAAAPCRVDPLRGFGKVGGPLIAFTVLKWVQTAFDLLGFDEVLTLTIRGTTLVAVAAFGVMRRHAQRLFWRDGKSVTVRPSARTSS